MPTRQTAPLGAPCWVDLMTSDTEISRSFYSQLFGWTAEEPAEEFGGYFNFSKDGVLVAGCMASQPDSGVPDVWSVYLATDEAVQTVDAAAAYGGKVIVDAMAVADLGTMAVIADPGGAVIGLWEPRRHRGFGVLGENGTPSWFELYTWDYAAVLDFYRDVFRWSTHTVSDTRDFRYTTQIEDGEWLAGVMDAAGHLPDGVPSHWSVYFGVPDADAALATVVDLGGSVLMPAEDTPYGRFGVALDPTGAQFSVVEPNPDQPAGSQS